MAFSYYRSLTITGAQVPSSQTDFPVLVNFTDATLKTVGNGGHVQNASGFDIGFYSDAGAATILKWEMERYTASTGEVVAWVKIPSLTTTTVFYMFYGDATISTDQSDAVNVWTNNYLGVYHLKDGTTINVNSSTGSNNGTNHGATAVSGIIDGGGGFVTVSSQYIDLSNGMNPAAATLSAWANATTLPNSLNSPITRRALSGGTNQFAMYVRSDGKLAWDAFANAQVTYNGTGSHTLSTGTWYFIAGVYDSTNGLIVYLNAAQDKTVAANGPLVTTAAPSYIGVDPNLGSTTYWNGSIDEVKFSSIARSADWITIEYNNQQTSSTFLTLGAETTNVPQRFIFAWH